MCICQSDNKYIYLFCYQQQSHRVYCAMDIYTKYKAFYPIKFMRHLITKRNVIKNFNPGFKFFLKFFNQYLLRTHIFVTKLRKDVKRILPFHIHQTLPYERLNYKILSNPGVNYSNFDSRPLSQTFRIKSGSWLLFNYSRQIKVAHESELNARTIFAEILKTEERFSSNSIFLPSAHLHYNIDVKVLHSYDGSLVVTVRLNYYTMD